MRGVLGVLFLAACQVPAGEGALVDDTEEPNTATGYEDVDGPLKAYVEAAEAFHVPLEVLVALAGVQTGHEMVDGLEEFEGRPVNWGVMGIRDDLVDEAAALAGTEEGLVRTLRRHNIGGAAAILDARAEALGIDRSDLGAWAPVLADFSGIELPAGQAGFVAAVYERMDEGLDVEGMRVPGVRAEPDFPPANAPYAAAERSYAVWHASPNNSSRTTPPGMVIIHTCEGAYSGCWSWLANSASGVSAHYVINESGSEVSQLVLEDRKAWHISADYDCSRNDGVDCWRNGVGSNGFTIGIEHAGNANQSTWSAGLLATSARLVCDITRDHGIAQDGYHVVGHGQLQPWNRIDPGPNWPWSAYIADVRSRCGAPASSGSTPPSGSQPPANPAGAFVIDSNNAANSTGSVAVSGAWTASQNVAGYYNTGYWWRSTGSTADAATFSFPLATAGCWAVEAWWPAAADRSAKAPWVISDASGWELGRVYVDQRANGGRWNTLGAWQFPAGTNTIALSRWTDPGAIVVADAVRLSPSTACAASNTPAPSAPYEVIVDSDDALNGPDADVEASGAWTASSATAGYYGSGYLWHQTEERSDPAHFWFQLDQPRHVEIQARWTAGSNRSAAAPFIIVDADEQQRAVVHVDQRGSHATWVTLGAWDLPAGWNRVSLSVWAAEGSVVVADAVRVRETP